MPIYSYIFKPEQIMSDKFTLIISLIGLALLIIALVILITTIVKAIKKQISTRSFISSVVKFLIILIIAVSFISLSLFLQTFSRYTREEKIGTVYAVKELNETINVTFSEEISDNIYNFNLSGDQWMIEGCILRWSPVLRWLGADSYYRVSRFTGRWEEPQEKIPTVYEIRPQEEMWKFLLKNAEKIPLVDTAYGIGAFQYPGKESFTIYINDTGFIIRREKP